MRLNNYLNESADMSDMEIVSYIKDNCQPWIQGVGFPVYRGTFKYKTNYFIADSHGGDRSPKSTYIYKHKLTDEIFKKMFGWKGRSEALLVSGSKSHAEEFGDSFMIFPIGNFKYIYSKTVNDFIDIGWDVTTREITYDYDSYDAKSLNTRIQSNDTFVIEEYTKFIQNNYVDSNLAAQWNEGIHEIMIKCNKYIGINMYYLRSYWKQDFYDHIMEFFK